MPTNSSHNFSWPTKVLTRSFSNISLASKKGIKGAASLFYDAPVAQHSEAPLTNVSTGTIPDMTITALPEVPPEDLANIPAIPSRFLNGPSSALTPDVQASAYDTPITTKSAKMSLWRKMSRKVKKLLHSKWFKKGGGEDDTEEQVLVISSPTDFRHVQGFSASALRSVQTITVGAEAGAVWAFDHGQAATGQLGHVDEDGTALEEENSHDVDYKDGVVHENDEQHGAEDDNAGQNGTAAEKGNEGDHSPLEDCETPPSRLYHVFLSDGRVSYRDSYCM